MSRLLFGLFVKGISTVATFGVAVILARSLGPTGYGTYAFSLTLISLIAMPLKASLSNLVVREIAKLSMPRDILLFSRLMRWVRTGVLIILAVVLALGIAMWMNLDHAPITASNRREGVIAIGVLLIVTISYTAIQASAVRGLGFGNLGQVPDLVVRHCSFLAMLTCAVLIMPATAWQNAQDEPGNGILSPMVAMGLHVLASIIALCCASLFLHRVQTRNRHGVLKFMSATRVNESSAGEWQRALWTFLAVAGLQLLNSSIDVLSLGWLRSDTEVGLYRILVQVSTLVAFGVLAISPILEGQISRLHAQKDMASLQRIITRGSLLCLGVSAVPTLALFAYGRPILTTFFGVEYATHNLAFKIILCGQLGSVAFGPVAALLNMTGYQSDTIRAMLIAVALNITLNLSLVPSYGITGAATATALSMLVWNTLLWHMVWKRLKLDSSILGVGWRKYFRNP